MVLVWSRRRNWRANRSLNWRHTSWLTFFAEFLTHTPKCATSNLSGSLTPSTLKALKRLYPIYWESNFLASGGLLNAIVTQQDFSNTWTILSSDTTPALERRLKGVGGRPVEYLISFRDDRFVGEATSQSVVLETVKRPRSPQTV